MFLQKAGRFLLPSLRTSSALCKLLIVTSVPGITPIILLSPYNKCHQTMSILIASLVLSNSVVSFAFLLDVHDEKVIGMHPCSSSQRHRGGCNNARKQRAISIQLLPCLSSSNLLKFWMKAVFLGFSGAQVCFILDSAAGLNGARQLAERHKENNMLSASRTQTANIENILYTVQED